MNSRTESEIRQALGLKQQPFKSAFSEGLEAAGNGVAWTQCPYMGENQAYERGEWLRGHGAHSTFK